MPVVLMYLPMHLSCAAVAVLFATFPTAVAGGALAAFLVPYFAFTLGGHPAHTGGLGSHRPSIKATTTMLCCCLFVRRCCCACSRVDD